MTTINRRTFLRRALSSGMSGAAILTAGKQALAAPSAIGTVGTMIDLTRCDGCSKEKTPQCVAACRQKNASRYPEPQHPIQDYWPQKKHEDWSDKRQVTNRLTPYNWTYVQKVSVEDQGTQRDVFVPRRCMHCDNPPCADICPFSAQTKSPEGPVTIDPDLCFGGAKCTAVCPWGIPARQAGVGLYLKLMPTFAGGGVMYKCDLCLDRLRQGQAPACVEACPQKAITIGSKEDMRASAYARAQEIGGYVYGDKENGGTSTFYVSSVPFENIHKAMLSQAVDGKPGRPAMPVGVGNAMDKANGLATGVLLAPVAGMIVAGVTAYKTMKGGQQE
ncbi:4Fe-4S dicluster domain-containing protein [Heliophilum fasciatum]|uniref:Fe-S-cluster-containing dehydrogenase component n=1 Tax=Heliophilum fasciatum TaxID=35700 RepID=A0A4R2RFW4_9FIRM|nr:4Fe-4S dicluster domain-containing protein [Heliophilum fasciatum]MCW2279188.1 Fe-S-cluster-containing dehydrogenase component [Heliophilum fasciatum]TCP60977.1 Fe-S-cluster-containing dehydrogenase component [Heliophilum fasciatum]